MTGRWTAIVLLLLVPAGYYVVFGRGHQREIDAIQLGVDSCYEQINLAEQRLAHSAVLESDAAWCDDATHRLRRQLTLVPGESPLLLSTTATARGLGLQTEQAEIMVREPSPPLTSQGIRLRVSGAFAGVFQLVHELENSTPPVRVTEFSVRPTASGAHVQADLSLVRHYDAEGES